MSVVAQCRPNLSEESVRSLGETLYGLTVDSVKTLPSERDQNFYLKDRSGNEFVLKIANSNEKRETLELQNSAMAYLAERIEVATFPRVCPARDGKTIETIVSPDGSTFLVRLLTYLPGELFAQIRPHSGELLYSLGSLLGRIDRELISFSHPAAKRELKWDLRGAAWIRDYVRHIARPERQRIVERFLNQFDELAAPNLPALRTSVIHNDANDYNLLVLTDDLGRQRMAGLIDYGDMLHSYTIGELAVALTYAMLEKPDPLAAAAPIVAGYHEAFPLTELELSILFHLVCLRLCVSVTNSAYEQVREPENEYLTISERPAWELLEKLMEVSPSLAYYRFRDACNLPPCPMTKSVVDWLRENPAQIGHVVEPDLKDSANVTFDFSVGSPEFDSAEIGDTETLSQRLFDRMKVAAAKVGIGRYNEARLLYTSDLFKSEGHDGPQWRTVHLGIDLFLEPQSPVFSPLPGKVHSYRNNQGPLDYGPTIVIEHEAGETGVKFFTLYGHLSEDSLAGLYLGKPITRGEVIARVGDFHVNGGWPPHLHFQIITDMLGREGEFPGVALPSERQVWLSLSPDPNLILKIPSEQLDSSHLDQPEILDLRQRHIGPSLSIAYKRPLNIVRGSGQYLYDDAGRAYLDAVNNVAHVGHCHPKVVRAAARQMAVLNTNTRYLHENLVRYAARLCATLPDPLSVCFFVCSGSEANELALRLARTHTKRKDIIVVDGAYHGNTSALVEISPYKFDGPGGAGAPEHVHQVVMPDLYRGVYKASDPEAGMAYAEHVHDAITQAEARHSPIGSFIAESLPGCGGQIVLPDNYLDHAYHHVRAAGGVCIADEVQVGFGRVGSHFWAFETQRVVPDIVTLGKPIGNGHPLGAVVTTPEIAASFNNGMEYFNTYGGNPVSCAVGLAVLDVIEEEGLQENAFMVGARLKAGLTELKSRHRLIGDVRGLGLFIGVELVLDRDRMTAAPKQAAYVVERMKDRGIFISTDGPLHNVLKLKPPLVFSAADADCLVSTFDTIMSEDFLRKAAK